MKLNTIIKFLIVLTLFGFTNISENNIGDPPTKKDFVDLKELIPNLRSDLRYYGSHNFIGRPIDGYNAPKALLTKEAANALKKVQDELNKIGFGLLIFDAYRPQRAVDQFTRWSKDASDTTMKAEFYPNIDKKDIFARGFLSARSEHSRGSTVDLTIVSLKTRHILNMGSPYGLFDEVSGIETKSITKNQHSLRMLLKRRMEKHGFKSHPKKWWHFTLEKEPYPNTYFDFPVE
ncbi:MAG: M15 family metallopeptidase [Methanosarcinales archaeon]|nr:M15 family metallopeptidase [Methanosarcinales archaeon]